MPRATAALVLAGGRSSRMGEPKAGLDWHGSTLVRRVSGLLARIVDGPVVVVRAPGARLPRLPRGVETAEDDREGLGPLNGIAAGLRALDGRADAVFVAATDLPFLHPAFARAVLDALGPRTDVALPQTGGFRQTTAAAYRAALLPQIEELLAAGEMRPQLLFERVRVCSLGERELLADPALAALDPELRSPVGVDDPAAYRAALAEPQPLVRVQLHGPLRPPGRPQPIELRAATLAGVLAQLGLAGEESLLASLDGTQILADGDEPLAEGDTLSLVLADAGG